MGKKKSIEKWYDEMNKQFEEDSKTNDYSDPEMDKWFYAKLSEKKCLRDKKRTEEWYEELNKQFKEDSKTHDYSDPEMDKWFYAMLDKEVRKSKKRKIAKIASIAAGVILLSSVVLSGVAQVVYGESLIDIIRNSIVAGQFTISGIGTKNDNSQQFEQYEDNVLWYKSDSIEKLLEQIINDDQAEINELFYLQDLPGEYTQWTAKYNKVFRVLTINSQQEDDFLYIYEELNYEDVVSGTILESEILSTVFNENLQMHIDIVKQTDNIRDKGYYFELFYNTMRIKIEGNGALEEFEIIARNISLVKGE